MNKKVLLLGAGVVVGAAAVGGGYWQQQKAAKVEAVRAALPLRPDLSAAAAELRQRIQTAEGLVRGDDPVAGMVLLTRLYHANGYFSEAVQGYQALMVAEPKEAKWPHNLAAILAGFGQLTEAVPFWEQAARLQPRYVQTQVRLGDALLKLNRTAEAGKAYAAARAVEERNPFALVGLGRVALEEGRTLAARDLFAAAAEASEGKIGENLLVTTYEKMGQTQKAQELRAKTKSSGSFFDIPDPWVEEVYDDCYDPYRLAVAGGTADRVGDTATGLRLLERAVRLAPDYAIMHYELATLQAKVGDRAGAERSLRRCVDLKPDFGDAWVQLLELAKQAGDQAKWERVLVEGLRRCPTSPSLQLEYGRRLKAQGRLREALAAFEESRRLRPSESVSLYEKALTYFALNEEDKAIEATQRALEITPDDPLALAIMAMYATMKGTEGEAGRWLQRARQQPRVDRQQLSDIEQKYRQRFGRSPW